MSDGHLKLDFFRSLMEGDQDKDLLIRRLRNHLLDVCPTCREAFETFMAGDARTVGPTALPTEPLDAAEPGDWDVGPLIEELASCGPEERLQVLMDRVPEGSEVAALVRALCERARREDRAAALGWAKLAEDGVRWLGELPRDGGSLALAVAFQANALYRMDRVQESLETMDRSWKVLRESGIENAEFTAELCSLTASLYLGLDRYAEAQGFLEEAEAFYQDLQREEDRARVLVKLGIAHDFQGRPEMAYEVTYQAIHLFRPWENPKLYVCGFCNMARYLCSQGKFDDALEVATVDEAMVEEMDAGVQGNYQWLLARIHEGLDDDRTAERHFRRARAVFLELGNGYDIAILSLHLASICYRNYRRGEALELASQALHLAKTHGLHPEARAALTLVTQALRSRAAAGYTLAEVTRFLKTIQDNPEARFAPPTGPVP